MIFYNEVMRMLTGELAYGGPLMGDPVPRDPAKWKDEEPRKCLLPSCQDQARKGKAYCCADHCHADRARVKAGVVQGRKVA